VDRRRDHAGCARGLGRDATLPVRALEREPHERRLGSHSHVARGGAACGHGRGAEAGARPLAGHPPLHRDRDGESTRGAPGRLHGAAEERADRADTARHPACDAAPRVAALRSRPARLDARLSQRIGAGDRARDRPAMRRYRDFLAHEYLPRARATIGVSSDPYGEECYRASTRATTGLELSADSIHRLGLATVAELEDAMRRIAERSLGTSDIATLLQRLRSDPGATFGSREEMIAAATAALERARGAMPRWFGTLPRAPVVVRPYAAYRERQSVGEWDPPAEDGTRPGVYLLSTYDPAHKSRADLEPLTFHETIPGHHL